MNRLGVHNNGSLLQVGKPAPSVEESSLTTITEESRTNSQVLFQADDAPPTGEPPANHPPLVQADDAPPTGEPPANHPAPIHADNAVQTGTPPPNHPALVQADNVQRIQDLVDSVMPPLIIDLSLMTLAEIENPLQQNQVPVDHGQAPGQDPAPAEIEPAPQKDQVLAVPKTTTIT
ncbi:hypothetical protein CMUS01_00267 [Colletotrichum musicola]|uniref:Uncharacterized protein n=1 Tax=Colletotrichum musicola TaxID=2175873 RepID=A0A8H6NZ53_9PEZI|nr:hypothetical protein CMUS01_00267 [Colletotrichum musicola]